MAAAAATLAGATPAPGARIQPAPELRGLRVDNGSTPFVGDGRLLTTVSPNGDGFRDRAIVHFRLEVPATVRLDVVRTDSVKRSAPLATTIMSESAHFRPGAHVLVWTPTADTPARTYVLRLTVTGRTGARRVYGLPRPVPNPRLVAPVVRIQGIEARFLQPSYAPGDTANVSVSTDARSLRFQVFALSAIPHPTARDLMTGGEAMTPPVSLDWTGHRSAPDLVRVVRAGNWPSGLYFLRITAGDGRVGYAPFILRPRRLGLRRVAVVLATNTWQAYNFYDADGDGWGDSWYISGALRRIDLRRPYLDFGVPFRFRDWDLTFVSWLRTTGKQVDFISDDDLARFKSGDALARTYDLIVFPGHEEYVTAHAYGLVRRYRDLGGNLLFLSANNFFWKVVRQGPYLTRVGEWRQLGRPEAGLVGVQFDAGDYGGRQAPYTVTGAASEPWVFAGTGLVNGASFGRYGFEIDKRSPASPPGTHVLATITNLMGPGDSAEMTYYQTSRGAQVFAAGALNFAASADDPVVSRLLDNVWARLSQR
ncbi:MAG TPA: N,N-dimethylformamidase beta subunit family domain-containing protein [Gaiellaceae bacterium]